MIRKAKQADLAAVAAIYGELHTAEEQGTAVIGWVRGVYPTAATAEAALENGELFVLEEECAVLGAAIINQKQVDVYENGGWAYDASPAEVMVLHTLVISPRAAGKGYGKQFVAYYEDYARAKGCRVLRMDTNARNKRARSMYAGLGYREAGIVPTTFNGVEGVQLVLLEKAL